MPDPLDPRYYTLLRQPTDHNPDKPRQPSLGNGVGSLKYDMSGALNRRMTALLRLMDIRSSIP